MTDTGGGRPQPGHTSPERATLADPGDAAPADMALPPGDAAPPILDQAFDHDSLYALRAAVAAHASEAGLPPGRDDDLVIAVHELAANAVRHGAGHGRLRIWTLDQALLCEVSDDGAAQAANPGPANPGPANPGPANPGPANPGPANPGSAALDRDPGNAVLWRVEPGHGLWLVRQIADRTSLQSSAAGTVATVSFGFGPRGALPPHDP